MPWVLLLAVVQLAVSATAPALYKCVSRSGEASYQSQACADSQRTAWVRELAPLSAPVAAPATTHGAEVRADAAMGAARQPLRATGGKPRLAKTRCAAARQSAAHQRDRLWNRLNFRQRSELDAKVARACAR